MAIEVDATVEEAQTIAHSIPDDRITVVVNPSEKPEIQIKGFLKPQEKKQLYAQAPKRFHSDLHNAITRWEVENAHTVPPAQRGETFVVPRLMVHVQGELVFAETDVLMEYHDWSLADCSAYNWNRNGV